MDQPVDKQVDAGVDDADNAKRNKLARQKILDDEIDDFLEQSLIPPSFPESSRWGD
jgi:hypothetical protein